MNVYLENIDGILKLGQIIPGESSNEFHFVTTQEKC